MRIIHFTYLSVAIISGCGSHSISAESPVPTAGIQITATGKYVEVLRTELKVWSTAETGARALIARTHPKVPTGPNGTLETASNFVMNDAAARPTINGGTELIGTAMIDGARPANFESHTVKRDFRLLIDARGQVNSLDFEHADIAGEKILHPAFRPADAATAKQLESNLAVFVNQPAQAELRQRPLWGTIGGAFPADTFTFSPVEVTADNFGAFGRLYRFRGTLTHDGAVTLRPNDMQFEVTTDKAGHVIAAH